MKIDHIVELITPKQSVTDIEGALGRFEKKYQAIIENGFMVSIPDNPMGALRFRAIEVIEELGLPVPPEKTLIHLNTFHTKQDLDATLEKAGSMGVKKLLIVSGDGGERLARLAPEDLGLTCSTVTAVELVAYIMNKHSGAFTCGVAFNPYEPFDHEYEKLKRKLAAGASFVGTQPVIEKNANVAALSELNTNIFVGAWMSKNIKALSDCVGYPLPDNQKYEPLENAKALRLNHPEMNIYYCAVHPETNLADLLLDRVK